MKNNPSVQQVHETQDRLAAAFDYNVARIFEDMRSREKLVGDRLKDLRKSPNKTIRQSNGAAVSGMDTSSLAAG